MCVVDPFVGPRVPIARVREDGTVDDVPVGVPLPTAVEALIRIVREDLRRQPSIEALPASVGPQIVWADTGRQR